MCPKSIIDPQHKNDYLVASPRLPLVVCQIINRIIVGVFFETGRLHILISLFFQKKENGKLTAQST